MARARRGDPLLFLIAILAGWVMARSGTFSPLWQDAPQGPCPVPWPNVQAAPRPGLDMAPSYASPAMTVDPMTFRTVADLTRPATGNRPLTASVAQIASM